MNNRGRGRSEPDRVMRSCVEGALPTPIPRPTLTDLRFDIQAARETVRARRSTPVLPLQLASAHRILLAALEAYADELGRRRIPIPPRLRDELRLQRFSHNSKNQRGWASEH